MFSGHVKAVDVVQTPVVCLRYDRQCPEEGRITISLPRDHRIPNDTHAVRIRDHDRAFEDPRVFDPRCTGHLAIAVQTEPGSKDRIPSLAPTWQNRGDSRSYRTLTYDQLTVALDEGGMSDLDPGDICDGVVRAGSTRQPDPQRPRVRHVLAGRKTNKRGQHDAKKDGDHDPACGALPDQAVTRPGQVLTFTLARSANQRPASFFT